MRTRTIFRLLSAMTCFVLVAYLCFVIFHHSVSDAVSDNGYSYSRTHVEHQQSANYLHDTQHNEATSGEINVLITLTGASTNLQLQSKFETTVESMFRYSTVKIQLHVIGDPASHTIAKTLLEKNVNSSKYSLTLLNVDELAKTVEDIIRPMQVHFSYKPGAYYNHALFFLSVVLHRVLNDTVHKAIMLDTDLKFNADISLLYDHFAQFTDDNILGIAHDAQPVYRHTFYQYRREHPGTLVGEPPPKGLTGFNSGVLLLNLDRMRKSTLYNSLLTEASIKSLCEEFHFKGHLGDQDFFSLIGMRHDHLFYVLPCTWNRQLCEWWRNNGYADVFDQYFLCDGDVMIYHGNCNTPIPR